jgi:mycoredoxin-dependent peroxiredoxin
MRARLLTLTTIGTLLVTAGCGLDSDGNGRGALGPVDGRDLPGADLDRVAVGDRAPDFRLESLRRGAIALSDYRGQKDVVLVFYRGHWWPYCAQQLGELRDLLTDEQNETTEILAVASDGPEDLQRMLDRVSEETDGRAIDYALLSDPGAAVIRRYGLLNEDAENRLIPHPTTYVVDRDGVVRWKMTEVDYRLRPENEDIRAALAALAAPQ